VNIGGTDYNVLYGGIQWGYTFTTVDHPAAVPEPTSIFLLSQASLAGLFTYTWRRRRRKA
jgi:hypothetical protein